MPLFDLPLPELENYRPESSRRADFEEFWQSTLTEARGHELDPRFDLVPGPVTMVDVFDVEFTGWGGHRIKAWLLIPRGIASPVGCVVQYFGYGAGRKRSRQLLAPE